MTHTLHIDLDNQRKEVAHLRVDQMRTLVGALMQLNHQNEQIIKLFLDKMEVCKNKLENSKLTVSNIMVGY